MELKPEDFNIIIGGGGYGTIYGSKKHPDIVMKTINATFCDCARDEYLMHKKIYDAFTSSLICSKIDYISIPEPYFFTEHIRSHSYKKNCNYFMEKLHLIDGHYIHICLNDTISKKDREWRREDDEDIGEDNPTRGFFASEEYIRDLLKRYKSKLKIQDIIYRMGYLFSMMIFGASIYPIDVEYGLTTRENEIYISAIDFGIVIPLDFDVKDRVEGNTCNPTDRSMEDIIDSIFSEIYYTPEPKYIDDYKRGVTDAFKCFEQTLPKKARIFYEKLIEIIDMIGL